VRAFVGVELDLPTREALRVALDKTRDDSPWIKGLRWLEPEAWHLTLQFLGHVDESALPALSAACQQAAARTPAFELVISDAGAFGSPRRAGILWVGVQEGRAQLAALHEVLLAGTEPLGFAREAREFEAHITVARIRPPGDVRELLPHMPFSPLAMRVHELVLFRSHLLQHGAQYERIFGCPLAD